MSDWDSVTVLKKRTPKASTMKSEQAINAARRQGVAVETQQKCKMSVPLSRKFLLTHVLQGARAATNSTWPQKTQQSSTGKPRSSTTRRYHSMSESSYNRDVRRKTWARKSWPRKSMKSRRSSRTTRPEGASPTISSSAKLRGSLDWN